MIHSDPRRSVHRLRLSAAGTLSVTRKITRMWHLTYCPEKTEHDNVAVAMQYNISHPFPSGAIE